MRTTITALLLLAAVALSSALVMRWELAAPGLSPGLSALADRAHLGEKVWPLLGALHGGAALAFAALAGCAGALVARREAVPLAGPVALLTGFAALLLLLAPGLPHLSPLPGADLLPLEALAALTPARLVTVATAAAGLGAAMLAAARPGFGWTGPMMTALILTAAALILWRPEAGAAAAIPPLLTLLAITSVQLMEEDRPAAPCLWTLAAFGLGLFGWAATALADALSPFGDWVETTTLAGLWHLTGATAALMVSLAALNRHWSPALPGWMPWTHAAGLAALCVAGFAPMVALGRAGMPPGQYDYPQAYAALQAEASGWGAALVAWWLAGVLMLARGAALRPGR